ncbi:E3 ubiquitin-protein ligase TRIM62 [Genypterus blacodes]|uniref:E3 ubiquitin-protein ligase TRIM62 n=1 Tax=Genypterus blacodes TaxID=154954 RepID=UPI003F7721B4
MAEKDVAADGCQRSVQRGLEAPSAGYQGVLQEAGLGFTPLDYKEEVVQPFPRSPKLLRKLAKAGAPSQEQLSTRVNELQAERSKTEAHIQSLKKRRADLSRSTEVMKQQVRERFETMRDVLNRDEQAVVDSLELDLRQTRTRLDQVLKNWEQYLCQVTRSTTATQRALSKTLQEDLKVQPDHLSPKKPDASDEGVQLNKERFQKLLKTLWCLSKDLKAQLQRKTLLLDWSPVRMDGQTCHGQMEVTPEGRGISFTSSSRSAPEHPLQFDKVCCGLGSSPVTAGQSYWEIDVRCCSAWAVGVAYGSLQRKGKNKEAKLGRNRNSWCLELRNGHVSAWHNDRHVACQVAGQAPLGKVGVWANYEKGQLMFYDAETMCLLQRFSAALTPMFDRAHHQFTEPLYPALRFLRPSESQAWPNHLEICNLNTP